MNRDKINEGKNRFLFNENNQFFESHYDIECDMSRYNLRKMMNYNKTIEKIKNETIFWTKEGEINWKKNIIDWKIIEFKKMLNWLK